MRKNLLVVLTVLVTFAALALPISAQTPLSKVKVSLDVNKTDIQTVIRTLLKREKVSYLIDDNVQGNVTAYLEDISLEDALTLVLRQVNASFRFEHGAYKIFKPEWAKEAGPTVNDSKPGTISLKLKDFDVRDALGLLCKKMNVSFSIAPQVEGKVTLTLNNADFELALQSILKLVDATYRVEGGVYQIVKRGS